MARRCKLCKKEIKTASKCTDIVEKKGYCSVKCLAEHQAQKRVEAQRRKEAKELREAKEKIKTRKDYLDEAQKWVNKYIRIRDAGKPCISCGKPDDGTHQIHASHYRSRGACSSLRFHEDNIHASCAQCNTMKSGNILEYRIGIIKKIGEDRVKWLESQPKNYKWTIDEAKAITKEYKDKCRL